MKNSVVVSLIVLSLLPILTTQAGVREEWVARYNDPYNGADGAEAIVVDAQANVYVTGTAWGGSAVSYDYATIKYDTNGTQLWVARYDGPAHGTDDAHAMALDAAGNVYVTGESAGDLQATDPQDYATVNYDTNGNQIWVARYDGPAKDYDTAKAIALDAAGNVYVTGYSKGLGTGFDYATIKYDANGNQLWVARYNSSAGDSPDYGAALAVDGDGNVYVTGESSMVGGNPDYATVKYDTNGNQLWVARYNGPGNGPDTARAIVLDAGRNVYVTGSSLGSGTGYDYATIKYDTNGNQLWVARYNGPTSGSDHAYAIAIDARSSACAIYVTGASSRAGGTGFFDYTTVKYTLDGTQVWVARYSGLPGLNRSNIPTAMALDATGNVYVTGWGGGAVTGSYDQDYATVKYDVNGNEIWVIRYNFAYGLEDLAKAIALDSSGNVYVTGASNGDSTDYDFATIKYSQW